MENNSALGPAEASVSMISGGYTDDIGIPSWSKNDLDKKNLHSSTSVPRNRTQD